MNNNYYVSSFFWSTFSKVLSAILGFISIPILLGYYGKAEYGVLSIATACNGYMNILDLGMNIGAVKFFSQWKAQGKTALIFRVARTNISFYLLVSCINIVGLLIIAVWGRSFFSIDNEQFHQLRECLFIIALFSVFSWVTTAFNQLLIADKQLSFTMKVQCIQVVLKGILIFFVITYGISLSEYFFFLTSIVMASIVPFAVKCRKEMLIDSILPAYHWSDFRIILKFSLSIFALSLFQMTAMQSRPLILSMFAENGADVVAEFRIIEVVPQLIIMIGGTFSSIFLPKATEMVAKNDHKAIENFAYKWTKLTTIVVNVLCFPFILSSSDILSAYVGSEYASLSKWLILWCFTVLIQMHTTPGNSLVLAHGKTKQLVIMTSIACVISMLMNMIFCKYLGVGSAVTSYLLYVLVIIGLYYLVFYKKLLNLSRIRLFKCFIYPTLIALISYLIVNAIPINSDMIDVDLRMAYLLSFIIRSMLWISLYFVFLFCSKVVNINMFKAKYENMPS